MMGVNASVRNAVDVMSPWKGKQRHLLRKRSRQRMDVIARAAAQWIAATWAGSGSARYRPDLSGNVPPFIRFRRMAKAVALMQKVCRICKRIVYESVSSEDWFKLIGTFVEGDEKFFEKNPVRRQRPFITFVNDDDNDELIQLTFDKNEFARDTRSDHLMTPEIREILKEPPNSRTIHQQNELVRFLKVLSMDFNGYPLEIQRRLAKCLFYDRYYPSRVLTRQGLMADQVFFVLSGTLVEKSGDRRGLRELKAGDRFGDEDIVCGCPRRSTVVTKSTVELLSVHRLDYREIFNMADDSNNPRYLETCRRDVVFQHFPMKTLIENPGTWAVLSYKFGRLMVKDSNDIEWIYVIKSGEARIIRRLETTQLDFDAVKKRQNAKRKEDRYVHRTQMIDFIDNKKNTTSQYERDTYIPSISFQPQKLKSARVGNSKAQLVTYGPHMAGRTSQNASSLRRNQFSARQLPRPMSQPHVDQRRLKRVSKSGQIPHSAILPRHKDQLTHRVKSSSTAEINQNSDDSTSIEIVIDLADKPNEAGSLTSRSNSSNSSSCKSDQSAKPLVAFAKPPGFMVQTPATDEMQLPGINNESRRSGKAKMMNVPPFYMLESLHAGQVFGFRSCLEEEERGPSVSLISGGCEVLQVSKKFFMMHADESILSLIRCKYKSFPTEEEILDSLDANLEWQEYKQNTVVDYLRKKGKPASQYASTQVF